MKGLRTELIIGSYLYHLDKEGIFMEKKEEMATSLFAISIVARKLAKELLNEMEVKKYVKNKATNGSKGRCRESCI